MKCQHTYPTFFVSLTHELCSQAVDGGRRGQRTFQNQAGDRCRRARGSTLAGFDTSARGESQAEALFTETRVRFAPSIPACMQLFLPRAQQDTHRTNRPADDNTSVEQAEERDQAVVRQGPGIV